MSLVSLYDAASLWMTPSGAEDGKLFSQLPTDGSGDFTFSRGSNLAATRVDVNGLIEKGRENLAKYSNQFDNAYWISGAGTKPTTTQDQTDPFGNPNNAWTITGAGTQYSRLMLPSQVISTTITTLSFFVKQGTATEITIWTAQSSVASLTYNFDTQVIGGANGVYNVIRKVDNIGNGWYRVAMSLNRSSGSSSETWGLNFDGSSDSVILYGAQQEQGLVATDYIETGASTAQAGILEDMPRLDYSGGASCPSLLLEPQRQNIYTQSEYNPASSGASRLFWNGNKYNFCDSFFTPIPAFEATGTGAGYLFNMVGLAATGEHTFSAFVKLPTINQMTNVTGVEINTFNQFSNSNTYFNLVNGTLVSSTANAAHIVSFPNGWYRIDVTETAISTTSGFGFLMYITDSGNNRVDIQSSDIGKDAIVTAGWQLEQGSYPTSYIPTYGTSQTRSYDTANDLDLDGLFNGNSYTILFDIDLNDTFNNKVFAEAKKSTGSSSFTFRNFNGLLRVYNNLDSTYLTGSIASDSSKWVVRIDGSTADVFSYNSGSPTKTSGTPLATIRDFGKINFSGGPTISSLNQFLIFPTALSDAECNSLVQ